MSLWDWYCRRKSFTISINNGTSSPWFDAAAWWDLGKLKTDTEHLLREGDLFVMASTCYKVEEAAFLLKSGYQQITAAYVGAVPSTCGCECPI